MRLSSVDLETLRKQPQRSRLYLSIFQPRPIFQAQINDSSITRGARVITFDNVTLGATAAVEANFLMLVGSTSGARDIGEVRVRSVSGAAFTVSENSDIPWANDQFITILRFVKLDPIYPRLIQDPADEENVIFYKDYDLAYSNQNSILGTFVNAGNHRALFRGEASYWVSTGTHNLLGDSLNYNWSFEGGTPTGSTSATPGNVTYLTPGHYVTRLVISGSSGGVDTTYRYVSVYDRPGEGSSSPTLKWELANLSGSREEGGYKASFKVHESVTVVENSVVVIFAEDWYGATKQSFGGSTPNNEKIFFVGYVLEGSIQYDWQHSTVDFQVGSLSEIMKQALGFSISVESKITPSKWYELLDMDCRRAIYHYLKWHTTALQIADFQFVGDDYKIQFFDADRASMYDAIDNLMRNTLIGKVVSDRQGKMWMEVDAKAYSNPTGSFSSVMNISRRDWMGNPTIEERQSDSLSYLEYGGIAYSGVNTGTFSAILGSAPGNAPSFRGRIDVHQGLALLGQNQLNQLVGNVWANENSRFPRISMDMGINARNLDIAPQETTFPNILSTDTVRGIAVNGLYIPNGMRWKYDARESSLLPSVDFVNLVSGFPGESIIMDSSPDDFEGGGSVPGLQIPPLPIFTAPASSTTVINNAISSFITDYAWFSHESALGTSSQASNGISIGAFTLLATTAGIGFVPIRGGIYQFNLFFTGNKFVVGGASEDAGLSIENGSGQSLFQYVYAPQSNDSSGHRTSGALSGIMYVEGGASCTFDVDASGMSAANTSFYASMVRISA